MNELTLSLSTGVVSGIISSLLFFWMIAMLRPKMKIGGEICKVADHHGTYYAFKIINKSSYSILDLRVEVLLKTPFNSNGGANYKITWLQLKRDRILQFPRFRKNDKEANYALIVITRDDLEGLWNTDAQFVEVKIYGRHALSGISKSFEQKYYTKRNSIKPGLFNFGNSFEIS